MTGLFMPNKSNQADRRPGGQPGNQNAVKPETRKRVTVGLYQKQIKLAQALANKLEISRDEAVRQAIEFYATHLGLGDGS